jgi:hypothetical protein
MATNVAPWDDAQSDVSDAESWAGTDPAELLETITATASLRNDADGEYPWLLDLLGEWNVSPSAAQSIVDAVRIKSLEEFKVALDLAFSKPPLKYADDDATGSLRTFWSWARKQRTIKTALQLGETPTISVGHLVYDATSADLQGSLQSSTMTPSVGPEATPKKYLRIYRSPVRK